MWYFVERIVLVLGAIVLGKQVSNLIKQGKSINPAKLYPPEEVARILGVSIKEVDHLVEGGRLPVREIGEKRFISGKDLLQYLG